jgi:hypothetical protein
LIERKNFLVDPAIVILSIPSLRVVAELVMLRPDSNVRAVECPRGTKS